MVKFQRFILFAVLLGLLFVSSRAVFAQSSDQSLPTPVLSNEISGTIAALDLGDPRLTHHFYAFEATPGDLIVKVNSQNLNGDVDVFTAVTFRPLMKISIYANTIPPEVRKGLYFRTRQILILRVEARTPNDDAGVYRITFSGSFQAFSGGIPVAETSEETTETAQAGNRRTKRLSSVGATIEEPAAEVKPEEAKAPEIAAEKPAEETPTVNKPEPKPRTTRTTPTRTSRGRPPRTTRSRPAQTAAKAETTKTQTEEAKPTAEGESGEKVPAEKPAAQETPPAGAHLIIEQKDGTRIDRPMSTVRRVIIEGTMIVIILKNGRIERVPMSIVARMAIEP